MPWLCKIWRENNISNSKKIKPFFMRKMKEAEWLVSLNFQYCTFGHPFWLIKLNMLTILHLHQMDLHVPTMPPGNCSSSTSTMNAADWRMPPTLLKWKQRRSPHTTDRWLAQDACGASIVPRSKPLWACMSHGCPVRYDAGSLHCAKGKDLQLRAGLAENGCKERDQ